MTARACCLCGRPIFECMGAVLARDVEMLRLGLRSTVRELCGGCALVQSERGYCDIPLTPEEQRVFGLDERGNCAAPA